MQINDRLILNVNHTQTWLIMRIIMMIH
uniref:Uncharacterized protein n=1 Tax=Tetranychus urticae TaxID=32264 RepID=T1KED2_TETUR